MREFKYIGEAVRDCVQDAVSSGGEGGGGRGQPVHGV